MLLQSLTFWAPRSLALLLLATVLGCTTTTDGITFYLVDPVAAAPMAGAEAGGLAVQVTDLNMPQYLERFQLATRTGANRLEFSDAHQWGETLRKNLLRTLARNLAMRLDSVDVGTPLSPSASTPDVRILLQVEEFERAADGRVRLSARWQVLDGASNQALVVRRADLVADATTKAGDWSAMVASMQTLFAQVSTAIAQDVLDSRAAGGAG